MRVMSLYHISVHVEHKIKLNQGGYFSVLRVISNNRPIDFLVGIRHFRYKKTILIEFNRQKLPKLHVVQGDEKIVHRVIKILKNRDKNDR